MNEEDNAGEELPTPETNDTDEKQPQADTANTTTEPTETTSAAETRKLPEKGAGEAAAHRIAAEAATQSSEDKPEDDTDGKTTASFQPADESGNVAFLLTALLLPLLVVGGIYGYAAYQNSHGHAYKPEVTPSGELTISPVNPKVRANNTAPAAPGGTPKVAAVEPNQPTHTAEAHSSGGEVLHWGYGTANGPANWAKLDPAFKVCGNGKTQSPIDIPVTASEPGPRFEYDYRASGGTMVNNGHSVQIDLPPGNRLLVNGKAYELKQFHFHTPSENKIGGRSFPMEVHLVHQNASGQYAVVAVMIEEGGSIPLLDHMPVPETGTNAVSTDQPIINPLALLPAYRAAYTFTGSLTTPPCSENVGWIVMQRPVRVANGTIARFHEVMGTNNRPVQTLNGRIIYAAN